jgi:hypothetical protein
VLLVAVGHMKGHMLGCAFALPVPLFPFDWAARGCGPFCICAVQLDMTDLDAER